MPSWPCGTKLLREFIFFGLALFCVLRELIFVIWTGCFFLLEIIYGDPEPRVIDNVFAFVEYVQ